MDILAYFNVLNLILGAVVGRVSQSWLLVFVGTIIAAFGIDVAYDTFTHQNPFLHLANNDANFIGIGVIASAVYAFRRYQEDHDEL